VAILIAIAMTAASLIAEAAPTPTGPPAAGGFHPSNSTDVDFISNDGTGSVNTDPNASHWIIANAGVFYVPTGASGVTYTTKVWARNNGQSLSCWYEAVIPSTGAFFVGSPVTITASGVHNLDISVGFTTTGGIYAALSIQCLLPKVVSGVTAGVIGVTPLP
jgi:hypothetical protein